MRNEATYFRAHAHGVRNRQPSNALYIPRGTEPGLRILRDGIPLQNRDPQILCIPSR
jgi:hypothetical protein